MKEQRIPLVGSAVVKGENPYDYTSNTTRQEQLFQNCFVDITRNAVTRSARVTVNKRTGFSKTQVADVGYQAGTGAVVWSGYSGGAKAAFAYNSGTNNTVYDSGGSIIGALFVGPNTSYGLSETVISNVSNLVLTGRVSATGEWQAWFYPEGGAWTQITDVDYPGRPTGVGGLGLQLTNGSVHMDGFMYVMTRSGLIYNSDLNSLANWTATSFIAAQFSPDLGVGLNKVKNYIIAFGEGSVEFFVNTGNATGSPLSPVRGGSLKIGAYVYSISYPCSQTIGNAVYFIGKSLDSGALGVYVTTGPGALQKISNTTVDKWATEFSAGGLVIYLSGSFVMLGMQHLMLTLAASGTADQTMQHAVYCVDTQTWWFFNSGNAYAPTSILGFNGKSYFICENASGSEGRNLYSTDAHLPIYQDDSTNYQMSMQVGPIDHGTHRRKFYGAIEVICDTQTTAGNLAVSWSDDGGVTFSTARNVDTSVPRKRLTRCGSSRRRIWKFTESENRPFRGDAIDLTFDVGAN